MLTAVMYHYVRELEHPEFPGIKGRSLDTFDGQLDYLAKHYRIVSLADVLASYRGEAELPANACLLSFDDGFVDHYANVFPRLKARGWPGCFFAPAEPILEHRLLDVHKVHFILARRNVETAAIRDRVLRLYEHYRVEHDLEPQEEFYRRVAVADRFNSADVAFVKRSLQRELPAEVRSAITDSLFREFVSDDEIAFAKSIYFSREQMKEMLAGGMEFGGHGERHLWWTHVDEAELGEELQGCLRLLDAIGAPTVDWTVCYPFGGYNEKVLGATREHGAALGVTVKVALGTESTPPLEIPRLDTNDLPIRADAAVSDWTHRVAS